MTPFQVGACIPETVTVLATYSISNTKKRYDIFNSDKNHTPINVTNVAVTKTIEEEWPNLLNIRAASDKRDMFQSHKT